MLFFPQTLVFFVFKRGASFYLHLKIIREEDCGCLQITGGNCPSTKIRTIVISYNYCNRATEIVWQWIDYLEK